MKILFVTEFFPSDLDLKFTGGVEARTFYIAQALAKKEEIIAFFINFLKPYYVFTKDGQYLFGSTQLGRRPDRAFYMVPENYKLGKKQQRFNTKIGKKIYEVALEYIHQNNPPLIVMDGIQGEYGYEVGLRFIVSVKNPHSAYIAWMAKMMVFPPKNNMSIDCLNYCIQEKLSDKFVKNTADVVSVNQKVTVTVLTVDPERKRISLSMRSDASPPGQPGSDT